MRVLFMGNNLLGSQVLEWLLETGEQVVGVMLHPNSNRRYGERFQELVRQYELPQFEATILKDIRSIDRISVLRPDIGVSVLFGYFVPSAYRSLFPQGIVNLHPSYLPYNRGAYPNVWSIVEGTPAGVTIHYLDEGIDTGDIVAQEPVSVEPTDTGETLYRRLETAGFSLFARTWPDIRLGRASRTPQVGSAVTYHRKKDVRLIDEIRLDDHYRARDLIDTIRARTFHPHKGAYFLHEGRKVYLRMSLTYEDDERNR